MRVINQSGNTRKSLLEEVGLGEVFTYVTVEGVTYLLMCSQEGSRLCIGCVFDGGGNHPLKHVSCIRNGLECEHKVFKDINVVLENL